MELFPVTIHLKRTSVTNASMFDILRVFSKISIKYISSK